MKRYMIDAAMTLIWLGCMISISSAETYEMTVSEYQIIENEGEDFRVLLDFALPEGFESFDIETAKLTASFNPDDSEVEVWLYPIITAWSPRNTDWDHPWTSPGGDYDGAHGCGVYMVRSETPVANFIVTEALQILQKEEGGYYGFLMMPLPQERIGFQSNLRSRFEGVSDVKLVINTR